MSYSQLILRDSAEIVWSLDDLTESSSISKPINFINSNPFSYSASINVNNTDVFNIPIIFGGGKALYFTSASIGMSVPALGRFSELYSNKDSVISFWFQSDVLLSGERPIFKKRGQNNVGLFIKDNYIIFKYGTSSSFSQVAASLTDPIEPHHIIVSKTKIGLYLIVDGVSYSTNQPSIELTKDSNHIENDYLDFYGPGQKGWIIDTVALFPNSLSESVSKRHYVYGLGKNVTDDVFYSRGGSLYNFSTTVSQKLGDINWDYPDEWQVDELVDLYIDNNGIRPMMFSPPLLYSYDNKIQTTSNVIKFSASSQNTQASYIEINNLSTKIGAGEYPFLVKVKMNGKLPDPYLSQRIISYGRFPEDEIVKFDLFNDNGSYKIKVSTVTSASLLLPITNSLTASSLYIGMNFNGFSKIYFAEQGKTIQTASFSYTGLDPLISYFPPTSDIVIRIGSALNYNEESFTNNVYGTDQFYGTFERFLVPQTDFVSSANYSYIESYNKPRYDASYNSNESRFVVKTYGYGGFNVHLINISKYIDEDIQTIGSNVVKFGYPDVLSSSQVNLYATMFNYSGSVVVPKTKISQNNYLNFLNNKNLHGSYLRFDFEIFAEDSLYYPPEIKYFQMQTFSNSSVTTTLRDEAGPNYKLHPSSSSMVFLPETRYTPTTFITKDSGIKLNETLADFTENILAKPLDPRIIDGLQLWLDARFINGLALQNPQDDSRVLSWTDLSDSGNNVIATSSSAPVYRTQSLNILRANQATGSEADNLSFIIPNNLTIESSAEGVVSGEKGIKLIPTGGSNDSYIDISFNTASLTTFPGITYNALGSIKLLKPQTSSALNVNARKIVILNQNGASPIFTASSLSATNAAGLYSLSALFTASISSVGSIIRFYNGSNNPEDVVYWDNLGLYPITASSYITSWVSPLTEENDHSTIKFNGIDNNLMNNLILNKPFTIYAISRFFGNGGVFSNIDGQSPFYYYDGKYYLYSSSVSSSAPLYNQDNIYTVTVSPSEAKLYVNGILKNTANSDLIDINKPVLGRGIFSDSTIYTDSLDGGFPGTPSSSYSSNIDGGFPNSTYTEFLDGGAISDLIGNLPGDISSLLIFSGVHDNDLRFQVESWLKESYNISD